MYDVTNRQSFVALDRWIKEVSNNADSSCVFLVIGNKTDLTNQRQVETNEAQAYAQKKGLTFFETSAALNVNVTEALTKMIHEVYQVDKEGPKPNAMLNDKDSEKSATVHDKKSDTVKLDDADFGKGAGSTPGSKDKCAC